MVFARITHHFRRESSRALLSAVLSIAMLPVVFHPPWFAAVDQSFGRVSVTFSTAHAFRAAEPCRGAPRPRSTGPTPTPASTPASAPIVVEAATVAVTVAPAPTAAPRHWAAESDTVGLLWRHSGGGLTASRPGPGPACLVAVEPARPAERAPPAAA